MKTKLYLAILALLLSFGTARAQTGFYLGANYTVAAVSMSDRDNWGTEEYNYLFRVGHIPGMVLGYNFTPFLGVHTEVNYAWIGARTDHFVNGKEFEKFIKSEYIQVPVLFKGASGGPSARFVGMIGPQVSFLTAAKREITGEQASTQNIKSQMNGVTLDVVGQLGGEFKISNHGYFTAGIRGIYGATNANKDGIPLLSDIPGISQALNNVSAGVNVGLIFFIRPIISNCEDDDI